MRIRKNWNGELKETSSKLKIEGQLEELRIKKTRNRHRNWAKTFPPFLCNHRILSCPLRLPRGLTLFEANLHFFSITLLVTDGATKALLFVFVLHQRPPVMLQRKCLYLNKAWTAGSENNSSPLAPSSKFNCWTELPKCFLFFNQKPRYDPTFYDQKSAYCVHQHKPNKIMPSWDQSSTTNTNNQSPHHLKARSLNWINAIIETNNCVIYTRFEIQCFAIQVLLTWALWSEFNFVTWQTDGYFTNMEIQTDAYFLCEFAFKTSPDWVSASSGPARNSLTH